MSSLNFNQTFYKHPRLRLLIIWLTLSLFIGYIINEIDDPTSTLQSILEVSYSGVQIILFYALGKYGRNNRRLHMNLVDHYYLKHYLYGLLMGIGLIISFFLCAILFNGYHFNGLGSLSLSELIAYFIAFVFQGFAEELLVRGIMQEVIAKRNIAVSLLLPSLFFSFMHLLNDHFVLYAMINTFFIGLIFALMTQLTGSLWMAAGAHSMWNFLLGPFFGQYVSGIPMPESLFRVTPLATAPLVNGGLYGPEASIINLFIFIIVTLCLLFRYQKTRVRLL